MTALAVFMLNKVLLSMHHLKPRLVRVTSNSKLVPRIFSAMSSPDQAPPWKPSVKTLGTRLTHHTPHSSLCHRCLSIDVFGQRVYILVATQFRSRDDSFGRLQLCNLSRATECMVVCANRTVVTSPMNHHMI